MTELEILTAVNNSRDSIDFVELLNLGKTEADWNPSADKALIQKLLKSNLLAGEPKAYSRISLSDPGILRLLELQQQVKNTKKQSDDTAKRRRNDHRHDYAVAIASSVIGAVIGILGTLLIQYIF